MPWHRVISASGAISSRGPGTDGAQRQRDALIAEGVEVIVSRTGELRVDLSTWGWFDFLSPTADTHVADADMEADEHRGEMDVND